MAISLILRFLATVAAKKISKKKAMSMASKKFGKEAVKKITSKPKSKIVKHKTELQRVKEQIARDLAKPKGKVVKGKPTGYVIRNFRGKPEPTYKTKKNINLIYRQKND